MAREVRLCDRCGKAVLEYVPLNAIPRNSEISVPFELKKANWFIMESCVLCGDCVQSFFDWWKDGDGE